MFDSSSRYARLPVLMYVGRDGLPIAYVSRRFLPRSETLQTLGETEVQSEDRPDLASFRALGEPLAFWRMADANDVMDPGELTEEPGRVLRIPLPEA
jgi:hypothetical protein